jgi:hypothetical protein
VVSLASLALSAYLAYRLLSARQAFVREIDAVIAALDDLGGDGFHYEYHYQGVVPVSAGIPIQQDLEFPFEGTFPVNTTVEVPINAGVLGTFTIEVPIDTSVYVNTLVPLQVDQTFHVSTTIPVSMTIPIDIQPDDPAMRTLTGQVRGWLVRLRESF